MKDKRQKLTTILKTILNILHSGAVIRVMDDVKTTTSSTGTKCTGTK